MSNTREKLDRLRKVGVASRGNDREKVISDLRARIDRVMARGGLEEKRSEPDHYLGPGIEALVPGQFMRGRCSEIFVASQRFDTGMLHGKNRLEEIYRSSFEIFGEIGKDPELSDMDPDRTVFVDTETTGLSGGTGTYAFMVGIGYFEQEKFVVEQFLMRDQSEEEEMLYLLRERLARFRFLVSFNGKSFDLPLLESRLFLSRLEPDVLVRPHLDLLYPARRIWKRSLDSCRLANLEKELLGLEREDDVPGELIPGIYFRYMETKDPARMERVFYHNRLDILTLVTLTALIHRMISDEPASCRNDGMEQYSLGRIHFDRGRFNEASDCFQAALKVCTYSDHEWEILKFLSLTYKKKGELSSAVQAWKDLVGMDPDRDVFPYIELAKYYEHQERDYLSAEEYARRASGVHTYLNSNVQSEIEHRIQRIRKKREEHYNEEDNGHGSGVNDT